MTAPVTTLEAVEAFTPERIVPIGDLADRLGLRRTKLRLFERVHGLKEIRFDPGLDLFDVVLPAARRITADPLVRERIRYVVYAHTTQAVAPAHVDPAQEIKDRLGLTGAEAFALSQQNCASGMAAIDTAAQLLGAEGRPGDLALVVTGEQAFSPRIQLIPDIAVMGDAAAACLVTLDGGGPDRVRSYATRTLGEFSAAMLLDEEKSLEVGKLYAPVLAEVIREAVEQAGMKLPDIDLIIPHNVNLQSWRQTIGELGIERSQVFLDNVERYSHCFASDVFLNYTTLRDAGRLTPGRNYLFATVGLGATFAAMVITHQQTDPTGDTA
ncbi:ketoacyl-ACP synthase III family protein [Streptomyces sp. NBC_01565]|uniref:3-oxoacyl-ACP synthase III family protein n=1 Tax=unclassified Streptomyces TaxID=2593676 RepID=UPI0022583B99|nr:ketoacyl-ACP synthase III family protein [Streptomyces sp. NBC_01565]MCX4546090.1 ketoacyl-ACP synthase III family protein [Streptomyces sp. NBC_01565]